MRLKHVLMIAFALGYFGTWFGFGFAYRSRAESSHGTAFSFVGDILTRSRITAFKEAMKTNVDDGYVQAIFDNGAFGYPCNGLHTDEDMPMYRATICVRPMGLAWALYYVQRLREQGYDRYRIETAEHVSPPEELTGAYPVLSVSTGTGPVKVTIYPEVNLDLKTCCSMARLRLFGRDGEKIVRLVTPEPLAAGSGRISQENNFVTAVAQSYRHIDNDIDLMNRIVDYPTQFALTDFLYFSAVTISTLGYGDILPNSQEVRILVMMEALLGALFFGAFLSASFMA
jgi:voltage-gated potassium channel